MGYGPQAGQSCFLGLIPIVHHSNDLDIAQLGRLKRAKGQRLPLIAPLAEKAVQCHALADDKLIGSALGWEVDLVMLATELHTE